MMVKTSCSLLLFILFLAGCREHKTDRDYSGWHTYAGSKDGSRYSSNDQISQQNVHRLRPIWIYKTGDADTGGKSQIQCNPIIVRGILYGTSPTLKLFALDASTGHEKWVFDPRSEEPASDSGKPPVYRINRGVTYWESKEGAQSRIFYSVGQQLFCIDASTGQPVRDFGKNGSLNLADSLDTESNEKFVAGTTPGIIFENLLIIGARVAESADAAPGHIRAYDVLTGQRKWIFHTIPHPGEKGYESWPDKNAWKKLGGANNWAGMSLDETRGIVYVPTGSISGDFYGGFRPGQNLFANSLIALDAATGKYLWHFQTVHHDLWDRDLPANPNLVTLRRDGDVVDAVAQITKHGYIFVFDRVTGKPVFPINEKPMPQNALPGETPWPTQPIPVLPEPFARQHFEERDISDIDSARKQDLITRFRKIKYGEMFTPPSIHGSWIFPGFDGGGEWGGAAVDPQSGVMYVNASELPWAMEMVALANVETKNTHAAGQVLYNNYCMTCHSPDLKGNGPSIPSLVDIEKKYNPQQIQSIIATGRNMMPAFKQLTEDQRKSIVRFIVDAQKMKPGKQKEDADIAANNNLQNEQIPYSMTGYNRFLDANGYPGIKPPWGTLNAIDLNTGKMLWKTTLGEYPELTAKGLPPTGTENYGGPLVTKGGLVFIAATKDAKIRAFDKSTGKVLWEFQLPVPGYATPATYSINGKQYLVIACGGGKIGSKSGDQYIAFALP